MKKIRYMFEAAGLYILFGFFSLLPVETASNIGGWIGCTIGPRMAVSRKALSHIALALPALNEGEKQHALMEMWDNLGRIMAEYPHLKTIAKKYVRVEGIEHLSSFPKNQNFIFFGGHIANWEIFPAIVTRHTVGQVDVIYRAPNNPWVDTLLDACRTRGADVTTIPKSRKGARDMVRGLADKHHIVLLVDQKYNEGIEASFFNLPAMTSPAFATLGQKFDVPLIPLRIIREKGVHFRAVFSPPIPSAGREAADIVRDAHRLMEGWISEYPGQWLWLHRRWDLTAAKSL